MNKNRNQKILDLTLDIIYLVTGEDYVVVKTTGGDAPHSRRPLVSEESYSIHNPSTVPLLHSLTHDRNNDKNILERTNQIIQLLTGEVPIRCEDVTVYFSMEEWEYLDGHKDHYKDVMIENPQPFSSLADGSMERPTHKGFHSPAATLDDVNKYKSGLSRNKIQKTQSNSVQNEEVDSSLSGEGKIKDISIPSEHIQTSVYIKVEPTSSEEENLSDIYTPARHTNTECPFTQFREESATTKKVRLLDSDIYMPTDHTKTKNTSTCIKEEPSSSEDLTDTEICTPPTEHSLSECTSAHIKDELISWEERDGVIRDIYTATKPAWTENASILKEELASCKERNITDVEMYANTQHIQILDILINTEEGAMKTNIKPITIVMDNQYEKSDISVCQQNSGKELYTCSMCQKCFTSNLEFTNHQVIHTEKPFSCSQCDQCFYTKSSFVKHQWNHHLGKKRFPCPDCEKSFTCSSDLVKHERIHSGDKPLSCTQCGKCFRAQSSFVKHQWLHMRNKPFSCSECGQSFFCSSYLAKHQMIHTGEKPFPCSECGKCFRLSSLLVMHQRTHTGEKPFSCSECGKCFAVKTNLVTHQKIHAGIKPFPCSECGKYFRRSAQLVLHQRTHTGEKPFSCSECGKCFNYRANLVKHEIIHTGENSFPCTECGVRFTHKSSLTRHQKIHIGEKLQGDNKIIETQYK